MNWLYSDIVKEHFINPRNILINEKDFDYDAKGEVGNIKCGDQMVMYIKVRDNIIVDCRWRTYGCASAIASTSMLSEAVKGMSIEDAYNITPKDIAKKLGGLPENKIHCSVLGDKALKEAIKNYVKTHGVSFNIKEEENKVVCKCIGVTEKDIEEAVLEGARDYQRLQEITKIGTVCGKCKDEAIKKMEFYIDRFKMISH